MQQHFSHPIVVATLVASKLYVSCDRAVYFNIASGFRAQGQDLPIPRVKVHRVYGCRGLLFSSDGSDGSRPAWGQLSKFLACRRNREGERERERDIYIERERESEREG